MTTFWRQLGLCVLLFLISVGTVHGDVHGYKERLEAAFNASGALDSDEGEIKLQSLDPVGSDFNCSGIPENAVPSSVHQLSPANVKVVAALGDSITAAMGAKASSVFDGPTDEYRGVSWSIGGDQELSTCTTLPNIIKKYNPNVKGFSLGKGSDNAGLNVAESGAIAQDLPRQARELVEKIANDSEINLEEDWKVVTMWIGGNNLCVYCEDRSKHSTENYIGAIQETLDILQANLPRTFVNLVQVFDMTRLAVVKGLVCGFIHWYVCDCATSSDDDIKTEVSRESAAYQQAIEDLIDSGAYDVKEDFTVVVQPFFIGVDVPLDEDDNPDKTYFAPDCFHFNTRGHRNLAVALWNNMIEPVGGKSLSWELDGSIKCPSTEFPYFYTRQNSNPGISSQANEDHDEDTSNNPGINSQTNTNTNEDHDEDTSNKDDHLGEILGGSTAAGVVIATVVLVVIGVVWWRRPRGSTVVSSSERISLIDKKL